MQGLRSSATTLNDLANGIATIGAELRTDPSAADVPEIEVEVDGQSRDLNPVVREEAYRIAGEALRNTFKHARAQHIIVTIHTRRDSFAWRSVTTGKDGRETMRRHQPPGHFGLPGMRERAAIVHGRLEVRSAVGSGTVIELPIPGAIGTAHPHVHGGPECSGGRTVTRDSGGVARPLVLRLLLVGLSTLTSVLLFNAFDRISTRTLQARSEIVSELCHIPSETLGRHRDLRGNATHVDVAESN